jgi:protein SCO1/2
VEEKKIISKATKTIIFLSIIIAVFSVYILLFVELPNKPLSGQGNNISDNTPIGGGFILTDQNGNKFNSDELHGKLSLIYFGFTYCPDICPTSLQKLSAVIQTLDKYQIDVTPVFITIDPSRDTPALLKEYLGHFHAKFIGLTGTEEQIREVADLFKVFYARAKDAAATKGNYMLDHSSFIYLMDKNGRYMKHFYMSTTEEEMIEYIRINKDGVR